VLYKPDDTTRNSKEQLKKEAKQWVKQAKKEAKLWEKLFKIDKFTVEASYNAFAGSSK
jgi:hypothetical protein